ncbi:hypothetical protein J2X97_000769 [Epilithonimonas hungarica]|uniref:hypothetical protein n=1 Tax=Epilithonimonas hungarica TaxID=454006 RepID=UPI00278A39BB|nr:hypothetical protein [Epilithonimonas hungarica]MDP9955132.1 hypothetical protein [Epilithonimonas hungarica]
MKKSVLITLLLLLPFYFSAQIFKFEFTGGEVCPTPGNAPTVQNPNTIVSPLNRIGTNCTVALAAFNSSNWSTNATIDENKYVEVTVFASGGHQMHLSSFSFDTRRSDNGPLSGRIAMDTGTGTFSQFYDFTPPTGMQTINWDFPDVSVSAGYTVRFRIYGWSATLTTGTMRFNNVQLQGSTTDQSAWNTTGNSGTDPSINYLGTTDSQDLVVKTNNAERMRISSAGRIAIGGAIHPDLSLKVYGRTQLKSDSNDDAFAVLNDSGNVSNGASLVFLRYGQYQPNNPGVLDVSGVTSPSVYELFFSLKANGKLFLGTSTNLSCPDCNDYRLFVRNGVRTEKVKVDIASANGWADHVFKKDYRLATLEEVEKHINEKGHLPNVPSAEEVVTNGLNLGEMDAKLLEKVEELTLYSIDLNKKNKILIEQFGQQQKMIDQLLQKVEQLEKNSK